MGGEAGAWLAKARESLASCLADLEAGRFNSATNRAYYACFHAAVAALDREGVRPAGPAWEHRFVMSEFSGRLVSRRKLYPAALRATLRQLFDARVVADYRAQQVTAAAARRATRAAAAFLSAIDREP
jgi:uncharacterized protein (UPF0332 family)